MGRCKRSLSPHIRVHFSITFPSVTVGNITITYAVPANTNTLTFQVLKPSVDCHSQGVQILNNVVQLSYTGQPGCYVHISYGNQDVKINGETSLIPTYSNMRSSGVLVNYGDLLAVNEQGALFANGVPKTSVCAFKPLVPPPGSDEANSNVLLLNLTLTANDVHPAICEMQLQLVSFTYNGSS